jgi:OOP family OmpA-OmpF porin
MPVSFFSSAFFTFFLLQLSVVYSQNLVPNPGFEEYTMCPGDYSQHAAEFRVKHWKSANLGTPDHFHSCSQGEAGVPHNWAGVSEAYEGKGYAGIYVWMNNENNFREYLHCRLLQPLIKDSVYNVRFHFRLSSYSKYSIDRMGLVFSNSPLGAGHDQVIQAAPSVLIVQDSALTMKTGYWETLQQEYRARGGEEYLSIGNFSDNTTTHHYFIRFMPAQQSMLANSAYYYIDDVSVALKFLPAAETIPVTIPEFVAGKVEVNKSYVLKNIQFEFDSYRLLYPSFEELDEVVLLLERHPTVTIVLAGHTDDVGGDQYNLTLSRNRAKTVAAYLVSKGISEKRVEHAGYGKSRPLIKSASAEARRFNRRVEAMFVE